MPLQTLRWQVLPFGEDLGGASHFIYFMNERDFDNIFRRKMEQIPSATPDQQIWQNIDNQLNTPNNRFQNWSKIAIAALLLLSLLSNFFLWKKLDEQNASVKNQVVKNDTTYNKTLVYKYDTITTTVNIERKIVRNVYNENTSSSVFTKEKQAQNVSDVVKNNTVISAKNEVAKKEVAQDKNEILSVKNETKINNISSIENTEKNTQNVDKEIVTNNTIENTTAEKIETTTEKIVENTIEKVNTEEAKKVEDSFSEASKIEKQAAENATILPSKIKPVKDPVFSNWSLSVSSLDGILTQPKGRGEYNGVGISLATHIKPHWRLTTNADFEEIDFFDKVSFHHGKNPNGGIDSLDGWRTKNEPFAQFSIGLERTFNYKKLETFVGVSTGLNVVFPYEVQHDKKQNPGTTKPEIYNEKINDTYATFAGLQLNAGASYPIYKHFSIVLATQYQYNTVNEKLNWKSQFGLKTGIKYNF